MNIRISILLLVVALTGCQSAPTRDSDLPPIGTEVGAPLGPDGLRVADYVAMDQQRHQQAVDMTKILAETPDREIIQHPSALKHPTVAVKYTGKPPTGIFDGSEILSIYRSSRLEGGMVVYDTDLAQMTMILERQVEDEPYDYRELTTTVPYGYCLDFIDENLGKESTNPKGYILRKVTCSQNALGSNY